MTKPESPVGAVSRVLFQEMGIDKPTNILVMKLIEAVRETTPPPREVTIGMLTKILQALNAGPLLDAWAIQSAREIVGHLSKRPEVRLVAELVGDEAVWCTLEGNIAGMLLRICRGLDLVPSYHVLPPSPSEQPGCDHEAVRTEPAERTDGSGGA